MPTHQETLLLPEDTLKVSRMNIEERQYVLDHMGDPKRVIEDEPPDRPVDPDTMMAVLDRLRDEPKPIRDTIKDRIESSLQYEETKHSRLETFGTIDYTNVGVGPGTGQTYEEMMFDVALSVKEAPTSEDWAADHRAPGGTVIADSRVFRENQRIWCPWCEETHSGKQAMSAMGLHVYHKHREHKAEWDVLRKKIRAAWDAGLTFQSREEQMTGEPS